MKTKVIIDSDSTETDLEEPHSIPAKETSPNELASKEVISLRHKFIPSVYADVRASSKAAGQQVDNSLSEVPVETIFLEPQVGRGGDGNFSITDQYFAMPLNRIFAEDLIDLSMAELPRGDLGYICAWYSSEKVEVAETLSKQEQQEILYNHLLKLREESFEVREKLMQSFLNAILQSLNEEGEALPETFFWQDQVSSTIIENFRKLVEASMMTVKIKSPL